ncbi:VanZ family protein [Pseudonocardia alaniniphila]|uniref:VanZ family protein n=1 Tax=Pseudonocardia alaniniphila TaxID=75291 RepID=A0ABS9TC05_9PSEU|nr:VanZ family protein [Pseudonocardia alaniniphila]MCH6166042.1 VanZ family protein [Pseudonocardia alaniniphila]
MSSRLLPGLLAVFGGVLLAVVLLVPFVFRSYRRRGELGLGAALLALAFLVYGLALVVYTLFPVPQIDDAWCVAHPGSADPQWDPVRFLGDIAKEQREPGVGGLLANPAVQQMMFNVALFVPLGAYLRHYFPHRLGRHRAAAVVLTGFGVSLLIECTQLTGNWFLVPCPYRLFDVDDLLANTLGTAFGLLFAPLLGLLHRPDAIPSADVARPVTTRRRLLGMLVDAVSVFLLGACLTTALIIVAEYGFGVRVDAQPWGPLVSSALSAWLPAALLLAVPSFGEGGATLGQRAVRLRRIRADGARPGRQVVPALLCGGFGYFLLSGLGSIVPAASQLSGFLLTACVLGAWRSRSHRGLSGLASGLLVIDSRTRPAAETPAAFTSTEKEMSR